jgi:protein transport protein SEC24
VDSKASSFIPVLNSAETATRTPAPMNYVFALDVSLEAVQTGFLNSICEILLDMLYGGSGIDTENAEATSRSWWNPESKLAIVTFDRELCFYDFSVRFLSLVHLKRC